LVEDVVKNYRVVYQRDESGWWVATVRGVRGCHTQGRTVDEARRRIVEAMELFVYDARCAKIVDEVKLPAGAAQAIRACAILREGGRGGPARGPGRSAGSACVARRPAEDECP
jgi:predicted RNase H-like HicB family nuclease